MIKQKNKKRVNKKAKLGADKKSAPSRNDVYGSFDDEIIIGIPKTERGSKISTSKKGRNKPIARKKKVNKLSQKQIKRRKVVLKLIKWTCLLAIIVGTILYIIMSPIFAVKKITVSTDGIIPEQEIISLAGINLNQNIFQLNNNQIQNNIKENAYVDEVTINRKLPDEVQITIKEREPILMITYGNSYVYINSQGYMLEISSEYRNLPILIGIKTEEETIEAGNRLCNDDLQKLTTVLKIIEYSQNMDICDDITAIDISDQNDFKIVIDKEEKTIYLGDCSMLEERLIWAKTILNNEKGVAGEIFVNMNLNKEKAYFRERV